uniref:Protein tweety homolog n=1 Tax=Heterorhabditis bacteriophora TaxID=37862 RepID=A0A1I7XRA4_HETBA
MAKEYADALLGNATCDHGLLLVYLKDTQKLATFRGGESFVLLTEEDMEKLHSLATKVGVFSIFTSILLALLSILNFNKFECFLEYNNLHIFIVFTIILSVRIQSQGAEGDNTLALQYLLSNYKDVVENPIQRAESLLPVLGLITAILIVLCITGVLLALFFARFCCCCSKRKKDVYHVNTIPTYKTIEPLYVVTPPTRHGNHAMSDAIYSTPYSGSPLPFFPHTNASPLSFPPPPRSSMPVTPTSTFRNTVNQETPIMKKKHTPRSEPGSLRRPGTGSDVYSIPPESIYGPRDIPVPTGVHDIYGTIPRVILSPRSQDSSQDPNDLPFLDPNRKQETQTREELIY